MQKTGIINDSQDLGGPAHVNYERQPRKQYLKPPCEQKQHLKPHEYT